MSTLLNNVILNVDSYKASQWVQYPPNTEEIFSYIEARGGIYKETVFFGLQMYLREYLTNPITQQMINAADSFLTAHGEPFNREGWEYILNEHNGYLPLEIKAIPEGTVVPVSNILASVVNTDPKCFWLTSYIETAMLRAVWYPTTVATKSREIKKTLKWFLEKTADDAALEGLPFKLHDFGARGVSSHESAGLGGAAHLVNFMGTDTITGALYAQSFYDTDDMVGFSVPASEHSTITSWGRENEAEAYRNMFEQFGGKFPIVSVVSDSYDIFNAVENIWGDELKDMVDESGSMLVVRPDSGNPADVVEQVALLLEKKFGTTTNSKGYKVLNGVRILQGDGLNELVDFVEILVRLESNMFSTDNIVFGMGGGLLQQVNRDTCKFAMKASYAVVDGMGRDVYKDPIGDSGKTSKRGKLALVYKAGEFHTVRDEGSARVDNLLQLVYLNGKLHNQSTFAKVRERAEV